MKQKCSRLVYWVKAMKQSSAAKSGQQANGRTHAMRPLDRNSAPNLGACIQSSASMVAAAQMEGRKERGRRSYDEARGVASSPSNCCKGRFMCFIRPMCMSRRAQTMLKNLPHRVPNVGAELSCWLSRSL